MAGGSLGIGALKMAGQVGSKAVGSRADTRMNRNPISIAPTGVNLGSILKPFTQGSPENGGYPLNTKSRYAPSSQAADTNFETELTSATMGEESENDPVFPIAMAGAGLSLAYVVYKFVL